MSNEPVGGPVGINFFTDSDFKLVVGNEKEQITVPRLLFTEGKDVLDAMATVISSDARSTIEFLGTAKNANALLTGASFNVYAKAAEQVMKKLITDQNYTMIKTLLNQVGKGAFTESILSHMQYSEVCEVLKYLIDGNFGSLKNLSASLQAISTSANQGK